VNLAGGAQIGRITIQPGWRWTKDVKPVAGAELCMAPHQQYQISGRLGVRMEDGTEADAGPGEITSVPPDTTPGWSVMNPLSRLIGGERPSGRGHNSARGGSDDHHRIDRRYPQRRYANHRLEVGSRRGTATC
jgi:hypothetical protein